MQKEEWDRKLYFEFLIAGKTTLFVCFPDFSYYKQQLQKTSDLPPVIKDSKYDIFPFARSFWNQK